MKKLSFILFVAIILASCDKQTNPETSNSFIGEYWMETSTVLMNGDKVVNDTLSPTWSPVKIYEENGKLLVRTNFYGAPNLSGDSANEEPVEVYKERPDSASDEGEENVIEDIVKPQKGTAIIKIVNGNIIVIRNGTIRKSEPIKVKSGSSTVLEFEKFTPVDGVLVTNTEGLYIGQAKCTYEYGSMVKKDDAITWQVELLLDDIHLNEDPDRAVHTNVLYKR